MTVVVTRLAEAEPLLLAGSGSVVAAAAAARFSKVPEVGAVTTTVNVTDAPLASEAIRGQVTTPPLWVPPAVALTKVAVPGRVSVTTTLDAVLGPSLVTVMV